MDQHSSIDKEECFAIDASLARSLQGASICITEANVRGVTVRVGLLKARDFRITADSVRELLAVKSAYGIDVIGVELADPRSLSRETLDMLSVVGIRAIAREEREAEARVRSMVIRPQIDSRAAMKIFTSKVRSQIAGFMGALAGRKVEFLGSELAYLPLRCYNILYNRRFEGSEELVAQETEYCFELATGSLVALEDEEIIVTSLVELGELDEVAVSAYEYIGRKGEASLDELAEVLGSSDRAEIVVRMLADYGLLEPVGLNTYVPRGPDEPSNILRYFVDRRLAVEGRPPKCSKVLGPGIDTSILDRIVRVWGAIREIWDVYIPVYVGVFRKWKGNNSIEIAAIIDAVWGNRLEDIEELIGSSKVIFIIDNIIVEISSGKRDGGCPGREAHSMDREITA